MSSPLKLELIKKFFFSVQDFIGAVDFDLTDRVNNFSLRLFFHILMHDVCRRAISDTAASRQDFCAEFLYIEIRNV